MLLETSEPLFDLAASLNVCDYDTDLEDSSPVRMEIREELNEALAGSAPARDSRDALCTYVRQHRLANSGQDLAQYVSLALYVTQPPELAPTVDETEIATGLDPGGEYSAAGAKLRRGRASARDLDQAQAGV